MEGIILFVSLFCAVPLSIWGIHALSTKVQIDEARTKKLLKDIETSNSTSQDVSKELDELKKVILELQKSNREAHSTSHDFALTLDTSIARLESRMNRIEAKQNGATSYTQRVESENVELRSGG